VRTDIESEAKRLFRILTPAVARKQPRFEQTVRQTVTSGENGIDRREIEAAAQSKGESNGALQLVTTRSFPERVPETGLAGELAKKPIDVPQVAKAACQITVGKKMGSGVDDHVRRREDPQPAVQ
jgi:hypothetical protein